MILDLPKWFDFHAHFRQGPAMGAYIRAHLDMGCAGGVAMPNTKPPVSRVFGEALEASWSIEHYLHDLNAAGGGAFEALIVPLYLTRATTPEMIVEGVARGMLQACKYYPPYGTTNAEHGVSLEELIGGEVLRELEETGIVLCLHGEQHGLSGDRYFDAVDHAESIFYREKMPRLMDQHPRLRVVCEHVTSEAAVQFVQLAGERVAATVTPQHLLYTVGHLIQGLRYHLYCLPIVKFEADRAALRSAVTASKQSQFFAGTDSAPHTTKATAGGCAAGCFTGGCAPQLYAMAFEECGVSMDSEAGQASFERFLCRNGAAFYGLPLPEQGFRLERQVGRCDLLETPEGPVTPLPVGMERELTWRLAALSE
ncbi:MAG: Dihydroorotase [Verrucomicrobia subdivision 3 bacterium]|nr:Dihydroorotase [Limisphaerales bacterium]MCS1416725.1 Dihydroorotase [Limisphaerales bacterium]